MADLITCETVTSNAVAIRTTEELAASLGIHTSPVVLADRSNLVLELTPHPLVARVAMATSIVREGVGWLQREVDLTRYLDARGAAVTRPAELVPAGPFERGRLTISFWQLESLVAEPLDAARAGRELARAHRLLREYAGHHAEAWSAWAEAQVAFDRARHSGILSAADLGTIERHWLRADSIVRGASARTRSMQIVHGDAHIRNVLMTQRGPVWTDWEDAFLGPIEWDLASLRSRLELFGEEADPIQAACAAYDQPLDAQLVNDLGLVRNMQVIVWLAVFAEREPELLDRMRARLARLRK